jgi:hypothetical protein
VRWPGSSRCVCGCASLSCRFGGVWRPERRLRVADARVVLRLASWQWCWSCPLAVRVARHVASGAPGEVWHGGHSSPRSRSGGAVVVMVSLAFVVGAEASSMTRGRWVLWPSESSGRRCRFWYRRRPWAPLPLLWAMPWLDLTSPSSCFG